MILYRTKFISKNFSLIILLSSIILGFTYLSNQILNLDQLRYNFYSEKLVKIQLEKLLNSQKKWIWLGYVIMPFLILLRSSLVALCLSVGNFFYAIDEDDDKQPKFKHFFRIALFGEFILLFIGVFKLLYFLFIQTDYTLIDLQQYYPLSFINFLDLETLEPWLVYPLQTINLFEIAYFFVLVYGLHKLLKNKYWRSFRWLP